MAPELINKGPHGKEVDYWAMGIILFELLTGRKPYEQTSSNDIIEDIINEEIEWPKVVPRKQLNSKENKNDVVISEEAYELMKGLLQKNPKERLGHNSIEEIKKMKFFDGIF